ncbi:MULTISPECIES: flagellin N-terminal helical domain-containing protein [Pseudorhizobium]|uniref:Flagellin n=1 Tax=Pseudorhizobium pelagicum TaxID=1509405 RepID=A0A922T627_9HYPH|nr:MULTISPECIES: flagellin [Pseudorhizobium]MBU1314022.1 flagellin [Alphaproteobacteria bacterium]KEQ09425.1 flagellin [Pseudorhizobium pelagicum]KEQ10755.1 flagellin [Pseudorhizobium pelagicum]MBU1552374.1 flagellin [Alphaproteobacteria bacterium]MBU2339595.1 flagellin [Alphaproteobacteria bacterium]
MTSILTNVAAMAALQTLRSIDDGMEETQARVSTGLRVGTASDNAAYWSIATTMRSDNMALSAVQDALGLGAAKVDTAYAAMESAVEVVKEIKAKMVAATEEGVDRAKIQEEIEQLQEQLRSIASAASFSGENWMQADLTNATGNTVQKNVVGSFIRSEDGTVAVKKIIYDLSGNTVLFDDGGDLGILDRTFNVTPSSVTLDINTNGVTSKHTVLAYTIDALIADGATFEGNYANTATPAADYVKVQGVWVKAVDSTTVPGQEVAATSAGPVGWSVDTTPIPAGTTVEAPNSLDLVDITALTNEELDVMVQATDVALEAMISATADLGSIAMRIGMQEEFIAALTDSIDSGIGRLVDADMNEESTRLKALQTQQQLAIQSLSIANTASENILSLFRQ